MAITFIAATTALTATTEVDTSITCTLPSTVPGDVVLAWIDAIDGSSVNPALTNGAWTSIATVADSGTPTPYSSLWYRVIQAGDASTATFTATGGVTFMGAMVMAAYRGVDNAAPIQQSTTDVIGTASTARSVGMTTSASAWIVSGFADKTAGVAYSSPSGSLRGQTRQLTNGLPTVMLQDSNGDVAAGAVSQTAVGASTSVGNAFMVALKIGVQASLMPSGSVDTFSGTTGTTAVGTNWTMPTNQGSGGSWTYQSGQGRLRTGSTAFNRSSVAVNRASLADGEMVLEFVVPAHNTMFPAVYARAGTNADGDGGYYFLINNGNDGLIRMGKWVPNYTGVPLSSISYTFTPGVLMKMRVAVFGSRIRMRMWVAANPEATGTWDMDFTDSGTMPSTGKWAITSSSASAGSKDFFVDNFDLLDTVTPSQQSITVGGSITATGAFIKRVPKIFAGSITATGAFAKVKVVTRVFTGSITATGALARSATKRMTGSITATGVLKRNATKRFTGSVTAAGVLKRNAAKVFTGSVAPAGAVFIQFVGRVFGYPGILVMKVIKPGDLRIRFRRG